MGYRSLNQEMRQQMTEEDLNAKIKEAHSFRAWVPSARIFALSLFRLRLVVCLFPQLTLVVGSTQLLLLLLLLLRRDSWAEPRKGALLLRLQRSNDGRPLAAAAAAATAAAGIVALPITAAASATPRLTAAAAAAAAVAVAAGAASGTAC